jgi:hypothetical protein
MHKTIEELCVALKNLSTQLQSVSHPDHPINRHGWNCAAISPKELASYPAWLEAKLRQAAPDTLSSDLQPILAALPSRLQGIQDQGTIGYVGNGNAVHAVPAIVSTLIAVEKLCAPLFEWQSIDTKSLPPTLAKRLSGIKTGIDAVESDASDLAGKVKAINAAHDAAESLPVTLSQLSDARGKTEKAAELVAKLQTQAEEKVKALNAAITETEELKKRAREVMAECEDTYRSVTAKGLAAAFHQRCRKLEISSWFWVFGLIVALGLGAWIGHDRLAALGDLLKSTEPRWGTIWMNVILSVVGLGAPIWFAWISTKQIGQRFRLAEDYAYKASIAQAYEGFRREASRHDESFEKRLLSSALTRLDEAPLRWVEAETHGSPWHELVESEAFQKALALVPDLKATVAKARKKRGETKSAPDTPTDESSA